MNHKADYLRDLFTAQYRRQQKNEWIQIKNTDKDLFDTLADTLEAKSMPFEEYVSFHFNNLQYVSARYFCSPQAIQRFEVHQKMKNLYHTKEYDWAGDTFYVNSTYKAYTVKQVLSGTSQDEDANYALTTSESGTVTKFNQQLWEACEYAMAKFAYKMKTPPESLIKMTNDLRRLRCQTDGK